MTVAFAWVMNANAAGRGRHPQPIRFEKPLVGSRVEFIPGAEIELGGDDLALTLDELVVKYPAPKVETLKAEG